MFKNYLKIAVRNILKHKGDSTINLVGLCVAFTSGLLLFLSVFYEFSFDGFHKKGDNIYHLYFSKASKQDAELSATMPVPLLPALKAAYPEVKAGSRIINGDAVVTYNDKKIIQNVKYADADFLQMFSFDVVKGDVKTALNELNSVALRAGAAKAIFGKEDPINKVIQVQIQDETKPFVVSSIVEDFPENSSLKYDLITRFENNPGYKNNVADWSNHNHEVYIEVAAGTQAYMFEKKLVNFINQNFKEDIERLKRDGVSANKDGTFINLKLQPLNNIHTNNLIQAEGNGISSGYLYMLMIIGSLIIAIACINFINLSIGRSFTRSREIGLRKTLGAQRWQLTAQFWTEALFLCFVSFLISIALCYLIMPQYQQLFAMHIDREVLFSPISIAVMIALFLIVTLLAGGYPAFLMSRFNIVEILKGKMSIGQSQKLRSSLIIVQFAIAIMLMVCTLVSWQQISYLRKMPLGYNRTEVYSIPVEGDINPTKVLELMKIAVQGQTNIASITGIYNNLGRGKDGSTRTSVVGFDYKNREIRTNWMGVSYDFVKTLGLELKAGRDFSTTFATDSNAVVINEQMAALLREKEVIGTLLNVEDSAPPMKVIGVVKDFNFQSLHQPIKPLTLTISKDFPIHYILTKVNTADMSGSVKLLEQAYKQIIPNSHFNGSFLDQNVERQYRREEKLGQIFISGAIIAIILSCMGLLAMVILIVSQKTKEIGIRKVLGASVRSIISMISIDFLKLVIVSSVIAFPLAWLAMNKWLENYAYRITISLWIFLLVAAITVAIAIITVCLHAIRAALANPVKSLRTE